MSKPSHQISGWPVDGLTVIRIGSNRIDRWKSMSCKRPSRIRAHVSVALGLASSCGVTDGVAGTTSSGTTGSAEAGEEGPSEATATTGLTASADAADSSAEGPTTSETTMAGSGDDATTGDGADCEDSLVQSEAVVYVMFGDWPPTGTDSLGDDAWDIDVACTYVGPSTLASGILLSCDDDGVERQVDLQYSFFPQPMQLPPMDAGDPLLLRVHTGFLENWLVLSTSAGKIQVLGVAGTPQATLEDQSDYAPFAFELQTRLCPVNGCLRQFGLDITVAGTSSRVFEGAPIDIMGEGDVPYVVFVEGLFEYVESADPACEPGQGVYFVILARE